MKYLLIALTYLSIFLYPEKLFLITVDDVPAPGFNNLISFLQSNNYFSILFVTEKILPLSTNDFNICFDSYTNHLIGNHTKSHSISMLKYSNCHVIKRDMLYIHKFFKSNYNYSISLFRAPYGFMNNGVLQAVMYMDYDICVWNLEIPKENSRKDSSYQLSKEELVSYFNYHFPYRRNLCVLLIHVNTYILSNLEVIFEAINTVGRVATKKEYLLSRGHVIK